MPHKPAAATADCETQIRAAISQSGMIGIAEYMAFCLSGDYGYYRQPRQIIGADGDFTTAPEISQIFGELVGLWAVDQWHKSAKPVPWHICEFGPGRGTLMADALRAIAKTGNMADAGKLFLLESNPHLRTLQMEKLRPHQPRWIHHIDDLPPEPIVFIANEFFDAMPVEQIVYNGKNWHMRGITTNQNGELQFAHEAQIATTGALTEIMPKLPPKSGDFFEYSPISKTIIQSMARHIAAFGGAAVIIDYGHLQPGYGDTLQALHKHQFANPLQLPGQIDLTCHVDFHALRHYAAQSGLSANWIGTQAQFLIGLGLEMRLQQLIAKSSDDQKRTLISGAKRLTDPDQMGSLFKVMTLSPHD